MDNTQLRDRVVHQDCSVQRSIVAGVDGTATPLIAARNAATSIVVRKITVVVTTSHATAYIFRTSNGTPVILVNLEASKDEGIYEFRFGEKGYEIAAGENLNLAMGGAGPAAIVIVDAHHKPTAARLPSQG